MEVFLLVKCINKVLQRQIGLSETFYLKIIKIQRDKKKVKINKYVWFLSPCRLPLASLWVI
jgi:hypothetical protein